MGDPEDYTSEDYTSKVRRGKGKVKLVDRPVVLLLSGLVAVSTCFAAVAREKPKQSRSESAIHFSSDLRATLALAQESGKPVLLAFHAVWCLNCRRMSEFTIPAPEVQALADRFHWVMIDIDRNVTMAREFDVYATPHIYLLDSEGHRRRRIVGTREPAEFADLLIGFLNELEAAGEETELVVDEELATSTDLSWTPKGYRGLAICFSHVGSPNEEMI